MDNVSHAALGVGVFATYAATTGPVGTEVAVSACIAAVLGSEAPDADIIFRWFGGPTAFLYQHRQTSHSIPMWFVFSFAIAGLLSAFVPGHFWLYWWLAMIGILTHVGSDMLTSYGTKAMWPFSQKKWRSDALFTIEPVYVLLCVAGIILVRSHIAFRPTVFTLAALAVIYTLWRVFLRIWLGQKLKQKCRNEFGNLQGVKWRVIPTIVPLPRGTKYVVQHADTIYFGAFSGVGTPVDEAVEQQHRGPVVDYAMHHSDVGKALMWHTDALVTNYETDGALVVVRIADPSVRYFDCLPFSAVVDVKDCGDGKFVVVNEGIRAEAVDIRKMWRDSFGRVGSRIRLHIPLPRGYRSKNRL